MISKAVILAAGMGSRLCPLTPFLPKEMLPINGFPALHHVLREVADAGVRQVFTVLSEGKECIVDYLTNRISPKGDSAVALSLKRERLLLDLRFEFTWQKELRGTADAIALARDFMGEDPALVIYPDDLLSVEDGVRDGVYALRKICKVSISSGKSVLLVREIPCSLASSYGVVTLGEENAGGAYSVLDIVEKPRIYTPDRAFAMMGRFVIGPTVTERIPDLPLTDREGIVPALREEAKEGRLLAVVYNGVHEDIGSHDGYAHACKRFLT